SCSGLSSEAAPPPARYISLYSADGTAGSPKSKPFGIVGGVTSATPQTSPHPRGGRGARSRIFASAPTLFCRNGIHRTGVELVAEHAHVSKRTLYQHFPSKDDLAAAYLRDIIATGGTRPAKKLAAEDGSARDRLLSMFDITSEGRFRGCPFHNAAGEAAAGMSGVQRIVAEYKLDVVDQLVR